jgi:hypothetical protein
MTSRKEGTGVETAKCIAYCLRFPEKRRTGVCPAARAVIWGKGPELRGGRPARPRRGATGGLEADRPAAGRGWAERPVLGGTERDAPGHGEEAHGGAALHWLTACVWCSSGPIKAGQQEVSANHEAAYHSESVV